MALVMGIRTSIYPLSVSQLWLLNNSYVWSLINHPQGNQLGDIPVQISGDSQVGLLPMEQ